MIGVELFSGPGGMGLGAKKAGIEVKLAIEKDPYAAQTYLKNHRDTTVVVDDISNIKDFKVNRKSEPLILFGGPPCQGYSNSNRKTRQQSNPKNWLFKEFMRGVDLLEPDCAVIENVPGLKIMDKGFFLERICEDFHKMGYTPCFKILNAVDYGVPQKRERIFIVATKKGIAFEFPEGKYKNNHVTVRDALSDLPALENGTKIDCLPYKSIPNSNYALLMRGKNKKCYQNFVSKNSQLVLQRYNYIKQGGNWSDIPKRLMHNYKDSSRCHHGIYRRLSNSKPAYVIANYRKAMLIHPTEHRGLSLREAARLQSFPDDYLFQGPLMYQQQQVGDAVPPLLAEAVFKSIQNSF